MSCNKCKCKVCSCIKNDVPKIAVNGIVQNQNENDVVNIKVTTKTSQLINDSGFITSNKLAQISVPTKTSDLENDSDYTTNSKLNKEIQDRISADNLKLDKPTTVGNISEYPDVVVVNSSGNSAKVGASEIGRVKSVNGKIGDVIIQTYPLESTGDGIPVYGGKQNDKNIIKSIKSNTLYIGDNNGSIEINTVPKYNWIAYANDNLGKDIGMSSLNDDGTTKSYIGFAYNKNTELPSLNYADYTWVKLKGNDGHTDYVLDISNDNIVIPTDSNGKIGTTSLDYASSELRLYYGNSIVNKSEYFPIIETSSGIIYSIDNSNPEYDKINLTSVDFSGTTGFVNILIYGDSAHSELLAKGTINVIKLLGLDSYEIVTSVKTIKVTQETNTESEIIEPTTITAKVIKNTGFEVKETTEGTLAYKYSYQLPMEKGTEITPGQSVTISNNNQPVYIEFNYYSPKSGGIVIDRETIPFVRDGVPGVPGMPGAPGVPGSRGPAIRTLEWREGYTYVNNNDFRDYIYYRTSNPTYEGWYVTKGLSAVANSGYPDLNLFEKQPFTESSIFGNIIAENANLAGFIFRNQQLFSQAGMEQVTNPTYSNMLINGLTGFLKFSEKLYIDKDGITFFDSNKKPRIRFGFEDTETGTPYLRFLAEDGTILWEAGKEYTQWIVTGTTQPSWSTYGARRISDEPEDYVYDEFTSWQFKQSILQFVTNTQNSNGLGAMLTPEDIACFVTGAMPDGVAYALGGGQYRGALYTLNKGDIKENENLFEGFYITRNSVQNNQVPSAYTLNEGWHLINGMSGINGGIMQDRLNEDESQTYYTTVFYVKNGIITRSFDVDVHTKTKQTL